MGSWALCSSVGLACVCHLRILCRTILKGSIHERKVTASLGDSIPYLQWGGGGEVRWSFGELEMLTEPMYMNGLVQDLWHWRFLKKQDLFLFPFCLHSSCSIVAPSLRIRKSCGRIMLAWFPGCWRFSSLVFHSLGVIRSHSYLMKVCILENTAHYKKHPVNMGIIQENKLFLDVRLLWSRSYFLFILPWLPENSIKCALEAMMSEIVALPNFSYLFFKKISFSKSGKETTLVLLYFSVPSHRVRWVVLLPSSQHTPMSTSHMTQGI